MRDRNYGQITEISGIFKYDILSSIPISQYMTIHICEMQRIY